MNAYSTKPQPVDETKPLDVSQLPDEEISEEMLLEEFIRNKVVQTCQGCAGAGGLNQLAMILTGKNFAELTPKQQQKLLQLQEEMMSGKIAPRVVASSKAGAAQLSKGTSGAFVPGKPGQQGTIILEAKQPAGALQTTATEEVGEAIAQRAEDLGIEVAGGDVGARFVAAKAGKTPSLATTPAAYQTQPSDTNVVTLDGNTVTGKTRQVGAKPKVKAPLKKSKTTAKPTAKKTVTTKAPVPKTPSKAPQMYNGVDISNVPISQLPPNIRTQVQQQRAGVDVANTGVQAGAVSLPGQSVKTETVYVSTMMTSKDALSFEQFDPKIGKWVVIATKKEGKPAYAGNNYKKVRTEAGQPPLLRVRNLSENGKIYNTKPTVPKKNPVNRFNFISGDNYMGSVSTSPDVPLSLREKLSDISKADFTFNRDPASAQTKYATLNFKQNENNALRELYVMDSKGKWKLVTDANTSGLFEDGKGAVMSRPEMEKDGISIDIGYDASKGPPKMKFVTSAGDDIPIGVEMKGRKKGGKSVRISGEGYDQTILMSNKSSTLGWGWGGAAQDAFLNSEQTEVSYSGPIELGAKKSAKIPGPGDAVVVPDAKSKPQPGNALTVLPSGRVNVLPEQYFNAKEVNAVFRGVTGDKTFDASTAKGRAQLTKLIENDTLVYNTNDKTFRIDKSKMSNAQRSNVVEEIMTDKSLSESEEGALLNKLGITEEQQDTIKSFLGDPTKPTKGQLLTSKMVASYKGKVPLFTAGSNEGALLELNPGSGPAKKATNEQRAQEKTETAMYIAELRKTNPAMAESLTETLAGRASKAMKKYAESAQAFGKEIVKEFGDAAYESAEKLFTPGTEEFELVREWSEDVIVKTYEFGGDKEKAVQELSTSAKYQDTGLGSKGALNRFRQVSAGIVVEPQITERLFGLYKDHQRATMELNGASPEEALEAVGVRKFKPNMSFRAFSTMFDIKKGQTVANFGEPDWLFVGRFGANGGVSAFGNAAFGAFGSEIHLNFKGKELTGISAMGQLEAGLVGDASGTINAATNYWAGAPQPPKPALDVHLRGKSVIKTETPKFTWLKHPDGSFGGKNGAPDTIGAVGLSGTGGDFKVEALGGETDVEAMHVVGGTATLGFTNFGIESLKDQDKQWKTYAT